MKIELLSLTEPCHRIKLIAENDAEQRILELWASEPNRVFKPVRESEMDRWFLNFERIYLE